MIYLDNAATTIKKPDSVLRTLYEVSRKYAANAGHGGHRLALAASELIYGAAEQAAELFGITAPETIAFTCNTTLALNMAIKGVLRRGGHVIITSMEHNSVIRPVVSLGCDYTVVRADETGFVDPDDIVRAIRADTRLIVVNHASNVCGTVQDIGRIGRIASDRGILFLVDSAQSGGCVEIDVEKMHIDMLAFAGHKGLMGPQGTGGLYVRSGILLDTILEGGSGSQSESAYQPDDMPDHLVSGTMNTPAIAALAQGIKFIRKAGVNNILAHEKQLAARFIEAMQNIEGVQVYAAQAKERVGVVSINIDGMDPVTVAQILDEQYHIAVRSGLHCAPLAHETLGTIRSGTVRFSFSYYTTRAEIDAAILAVQKICKSRKV